MDNLQIESLAERNKSFSAKLPGMQLVWDSTSLGLLKECPRKYQLSMVEGYVPKRESVHLIFGRLMHSALEKYDALLSEGMTKADALHAIVRYTLRIAGERVVFEVCPSCGTLHSGKPEACRSCGENYHSDWDHYSEWRPWESDDPNKNLATLMRTVVWYILEFQDDALETVQLSNGKPAVELSFKVPLGITLQETGEEVWAAGHFDRVARYAGSDDAVYIVDRKTTKGELGSRFFRGFTPDNQMSFYAAFSAIVLGFPVAGVIIDGAQIAVNFTRYARGNAGRSQEQRNDFYMDFCAWVKVAEAYAKKRYWPKNDKACSNYAGCQFRDVCAAASSVQNLYLSSDFTRRVWDPTVPRNGEGE